MVAGSWRPTAARWHILGCTLPIHSLVSRIDAATDDLETFRRQLLADGVIECPDTRLTPLTGGVSSDIYRVDDGARAFVVKRALPQLRVAATWRADVGRNRFEVEYLKHVRRIAPENVPRVIHHNPDHGYFTMELLGPEFRNWKTALLEGCDELFPPFNAGSVLGRIHRETWADDSAREKFDSTKNFFDLRLDPYLLATADRHPALAERIRAEVDRIQASRECLVHGDYSPKNLLFEENQTRFMVLDCEVAWFGDAAFDVAFLLNHLTIKALHLPEWNYTTTAMACWVAYEDKFDQAGIESRVTRLLPMLMLARVDGKSPLEYLTEPSRQAIREFASELILSPVDNLRDFWNHWEEFLKTHANH